MVSRCGHSPLTWPKNDSIHAWSVGRYAGTAVVLDDGHQRHERAGVVGSHRRPVVRHGEQNRPARVVGVEVEALVGEQLQQALKLERVLEDDLDLGGGFLDRDEGVDSFATNQVHDREHDAAGAGEMCGVPDPDSVPRPHQPVRPRPFLTA